MPKCLGCNAKGMLLKLNANGLCADCVLAATNRQLSEATARCEELQKKYDALNASITPEMLAAKSISDLEAERKEKLEAINALENSLVHLRNQLLVAEQAVEMESFGLYQPRYALASSAAYKERLDDVRALQKELIRKKTACVCGTTWTVNGSKVDGQRQTNHTIKLFLRAFNAECDIAISDVKFSNFERCEERIRRAFESINELGRVNNIHLSTQYCQAKFDELHLVHEYALKKQEEKEAQAEIRRQQREQAKLDKEIVEARKAAEKELKHFENALSSLNAQLLSCSDPEQRAALESRRSELVDGIDAVNAKLEDIDYRETNQRAGYVYIISNIGAFGDGIYKIGMTRRLDPMERIDELGDASVPFAFDVHAMIFSADAPALESALHRAFDDRRVNKVNLRREYFRVSLDEIKAVVRDHHDQTVEFIDVPAAEQYRISAKL